MNFNFEITKVDCIFIVTSIMKICVIRKMFVKNHLQDYCSTECAKWGINSFLLNVGPTLKREAKMKMAVASLESVPNHFKLL